MYKISIRIGVLFLGIKNQYQFDMIFYFLKSVSIRIGSGKNRFKGNQSIPDSRALKLVYFKVERGCCLMTYPGLIPKLELKSPTTMVLLDLS